MNLLVTRGPQISEIQVPQTPFIFYPASEANPAYLAFQVSETDLHEIPAGHLVRLEGYPCTPEFLTFVPEPTRKFVFYPVFIEDDLWGWVPKDFDLTNAKEIQPGES